MTLGLSEDMYNDGYHRITNTDFSPIVISQMSQRCEHLQMEWQVMDILDLKYDDESFDVIIDKGTMDALMCEKGDVWDPPESLVATVKKEVDGVESAGNDDMIPLIFRNSKSLYSISDLMVKRQTSNKILAMKPEEYQRETSMAKKSMLDGIKKRSPSTTTRGNRHSNTKHHNPGEISSKTGRYMSKRSGTHKSFKGVKREASDLDMDPAEQIVDNLNEPAGVQNMVENGENIQAEGDYTTPTVDHMENPTADTGGIITDTYMANNSSGETFEQETAPLLENTGTRPNNDKDIKKIIELLENISQSLQKN
ncbi:hypothetical protein BB560_002859 [Smittium megazygosporum]|uniref:Methyltransferase domain-containing protein n=1 Tax=Smittium megazygosporum TaxID=133381 RepID=A0A2T9ZDJ7_9FUNG|nr:hypothetical protein BB560_002859 [Smittium megazygosporum]